MTPLDERGRFELVTVQSGASSLRSREHGETFHPVVGPVVEAEALHVRQQRLVDRARAVQGVFAIWDVGLGAAANAVAVLNAFRGFENAAAIELHSFDETPEPLAFALQHASALGYLARYETAVRELLDRGRATVGAVRWQWHRGDFRELIQSMPLPAPHAVLYDPYSVRANPGMWTLEHFTKMRARLADEAPCLLTNYTRSTAVRVTLLLAGFFVGRGAAVGEKDETTIASNRRELLAMPLDVKWLERVRGSTASAPLRICGGGGVITGEDFTALAGHRQFR